MDRLYSTCMKKGNQNQYCRKGKRRWI